MPALAARRGLGLLLALGLLTVAPTAAQPAQPPADSTTTSAEESLPTPRGALWRAALLPGWGQYYNGQYYKIPIVYAGLGALTAAAVYYTREHRQWDRAFLYIRSEELVEQGSLESNAYARFETVYEELVTNEFGGIEVSSSTIRPTRDNLRRNRDLFYVGVGLGYALSVLDAYVSAHLLDFDVSEELALTLRPQPQGLRATLRW
ncbi:MAG: hypothetical protein GVY18_07190 [Bacteroidetes bacterium]|jgi:hypothetical protein|nr:hypothetical protein [Bacteroidota bacterium]